MDGGSAKRKEIDIMIPNNVRATNAYIEIYTKHIAAATTSPTYSRATYRFEYFNSPDVTWERLE